MRTATVSTVLICLMIGMMIGKSVKDEAIAGPPKQSLSNWDMGELINSDETQCDKESVIEDFATKTEFNELESRVSKLEAAIVGLQQKATVTAPASPPKSNGSTGGSGGSSGTYNRQVYAAPPPKTTTAPTQSDLVALHNSLHNPNGASSPNWTWPGDLSTHLATEHKVSNGVLLPRQTTTTRSAVTTSNCPGGVCPMPSSSAQRSFRIFRR